MEKPLYGFVTYPQGVAHVTLALSNGRDISQCFNNDTIASHCNIIGKIVNHFAGSKKLPQRICTDAQKCVVFSFDRYTTDNFGNVRAYYKFSIDEEVKRNDGTTSYEYIKDIEKNTPKSVGMFNVGDVVKTKGGVLYIHQSDGDNVSATGYVCVDDSVCEVGTAQDREKFFNDLLNNRCRFNIELGIVQRIITNGTA